MATKKDTKNVRCEVEVLTRLKNHCEANGVVMAFAATQAITEWLDRQQHQQHQQQTFRRAA